MICIYIYMYIYIYRSGRMARRSTRISQGKPPDRKQLPRLPFFRPSQAGLRSGRGTAIVRDLCDGFYEPSW